MNLQKIVLCLVLFRTVVVDASLIISLPREYVLELQKLPEDQICQMRNLMRNYSAGKKNNFDDIHINVILLWKKIENFLNINRQDEQKEMEKISRNIFETEALNVLQELGCLYTSKNPENSPYQEIAESYDCDL